MNGELHSEHVISRSGIAVFSTRVNRGPLTLLHFGCAGVAFLSTTDCGAKALYHKHYAEKLASRLVIGPECTPANQRRQTIIARLLQNLWRDHSMHIVMLWRLRHTIHEIFLEFIRHDCCS
jgi:hypothetical protein